MDDNFDMDDDYGWNEMPNTSYPSPRRQRRDERYSNAYGNYRGGYGPGDGFGPPLGFGPIGNGPPGPSRPFGPPGPHFSWGRGFGPRGPPPRRYPGDNGAIRYLMRCGLTKENLKHLPRDLVLMYEPHHCGLCATSFETFNLSRIHYLSKNHLKNQKKWLSKQSDGVLQAKEIPMKARELYCELCDIHITSKSHADAHYAGKPHRGIVEGRKLPKNPVLLQRGMGGRLDMLIRREKRTLKIEEIPEKLSLANMNSVQAELYCNICQTFMTCSEQMTMHMNGKRHLSKEKQHILKMMKGDTTEPVAKEAVEVVVEVPTKVENVEAEEAGEEKEAEKTDDVQESFDWGNGSEKWEESAESPKE